MVPTYRITHTYSDLSLKPINLEFQVNTSKLCPTQSINAEVRWNTLIGLHVTRPTLLLKPSLHTSSI